MNLMIPYNFQGLISIANDMRVTNRQIDSSVILLKIDINIILLSLIIAQTKRFFLVALFIV